MTKMSNNLFRSLLLASALAVSVPAFAKPMVKDLPITHAMHVGKTTIESGEYRFLIDGNHLTVQKGKKLVAESEGRWEERDAVVPYDEIVSTGDGNILELRFGGKKSVFVLTQ
jgi:hypothetical protein